MSLHVWFTFVAASLLMGLVPGPGVMSIVGYAINSGRRVALASVAGIALGNVIAMSLSLAGVGALLAASATAFAVLKWAGAAYLIALGIVTIGRSRTPNLIGVQKPSTMTATKAFAGNVLVGTFHPKTIVFFVAFVPQFIDPSHYLMQATLLVATFTFVVGSSDTAYALVASRASRVLRTPSYETWSRRISGGVLVAAGAATAAAKG